MIPVCSAALKGGVCISAIVRRQVVQAIVCHNSSSSKNTVSSDTGTGSIQDEILTTVHDDFGPVVVDKRPKFALYLDGAVKKQLQDKKYSVGKHPGVRKLLAVHMPESLAVAYKQVLKGEDMPVMRDEAYKLHHRIKNREAPLEETAKREKMQNFMTEIINKETVDPEHPEILDIDRQKLLSQRESLLKAKIRTQIYNYKPLDFTFPQKCLVYMVCCLPSDYATLVKAMSQLRRQLPNFAPTTMLDFGSGVGSATWAVDNVWPDKCKEIVNVDISQEMNILNERLQKGGLHEGSYKRRNGTTFFRQYLPASATVKHSLVVVSRTLFELPNRETRIRALDILWKTVAPGGCLLLVEDSHWKACELMLEAREFLLQGVDNTFSDSQGIIVAPCPHQFTCPLLRKERKFRRCTDSTMHYTFDKEASTVPSETFSYLAIYKPKSNKDNKDVKTLEKNSWPRVVQPVKGSSFSVIRVCNKFGNLQEVSVCKAKHGTLCNQVGRKCQLGDLLPVHLLEPQEQHVPAFKVYDRMYQERVDKREKMQRSDDEAE